MYNRLPSPFIGNVIPIGLNGSQFKQLEQSGLPIHFESRSNGHSIGTGNTPRLGISLFAFPHAALAPEQLQAVDLHSQGFNREKAASEAGVSPRKFKDYLDGTRTMLGARTVGQAVTRLTVEGMLPVREVRKPECVTFYQMITLAYVALYDGTQEGIAKRLHVTHMTVKHSINRATALTGSANKEQAIRGLFAANIFSGPGAP